MATPQAATDRAASISCNASQDRRDFKRKDEDPRASAGPRHFSQFTKE
jgi:hypothetical protein